MIPLQKFQFGQLVRGDVKSYNLSGKPVSPEHLRPATERMAPLIDEYIKAHQNGANHQGKTITIRPYVHVQFGYPGYTAIVEKDGKDFKFPSIGPIPDRSELFDTISSLVAWATRD